MALDPSLAPFGSGFAFVIALILFILFIVAAVYVYFALAIIKIAQRMKIPNGWFAWIPFLNIYLLTQLAGVSGWWTLAFLLGGIPYIGPLFSIPISLWIWWKIAQHRGRPGWWGILMIVPFLNFVILGILAWGKDPSRPRKA